MTSPAKDRAKQQRAQELVRRARQNIGTVPSVETIVPKEALPDNYTEDQYYELLANVVLYGTHSWYIGRLDLPPETKVDWGGLKCRNRWIEYTGRLSHPDIETIKSDINNCLGAAAAAAIAAGLSTGNFAAAVAAFKASMYACLSAKGIAWANEIAIWIDQDQKKGDWYYCF